MEKEDGIEGNGRRTTHMHTREWEREKDAGGFATRRGRENETMHISCFIGPLRPDACHGGGVGGCAAVACAREGEDEKRG